MADNEAFTTADLQSFVDFVFNNYAENTAGFIKKPAMSKMVEICRIVWQHFYSATKTVGGWPSAEGL